MIDTEAPGETEITPYVDGHAVSYTKPHSETGAGNFANSTLYWMSRDASNTVRRRVDAKPRALRKHLSAETILDHYERGENTYKVANTTAPSIEGTAKEGETLTANHGNWSGFEPISYAYQWQRCNSSGTSCTNISSATSSTYVLGHDDMGSTLRVTVRAANAGSSAESTSEKTAVVTAVAPADVTEPEIFGTVQDGQTLYAYEGEWSGEILEYSYQWERCNEHGEECTPITGKTEPEYELKDDDVGKTVRVVVTATNEAGSEHAVSAATTAVEAEPVSELEAPSVTGAPDVHQVLYAHPGAWDGTGTQLSYQWESCSEHGEECASVEGATGSEYDLAEGDEGSTLRVRVGVGNISDALTDVSQPTPVIGADGALANTLAPSVLGTPQSGQALLAAWGSWSDTEPLSYTYQWQSCDRYGGHCKDIEGATSSSYTAETADIGEALRVVITAEDARHSLSQSSPVTQPIAVASAPVVAQPPEITGIALQGHELTTSTGAWSGGGSTSYSYQWERCNTGGECGAIEGATSSSYTLVEADVSSNVRVVVTATKSGHSSPAVSSATAVIEHEPLVQFSTPSISGLVELEGTLTADPGIWSGSGPVTYAYQWKSCNPAGSECASIGGATESTYTVGSGDLGSTLRVDVTVTTPHGSTSALSAYTAVVPGGELSVEAAQTVAQETDPAVLAPSTTATLEEKPLAPALHDAGEELVSESTLTSSSISKETPGEFAVNTPSGELSFTPVENLATAITNPMIVNGAAALFANTWPATDTILRAEPLGATAILQIRSSEAPHISHGKPDSAQTNS